MRISLSDSVAVVIDMQERLLPHMRKQPTVLENAIRLIEGLKILEVPIVVTQQYTKGLGATTELISNILTPFSFIEKTNFSCCEEPVFEETIKAQNKHFVIVTGIEAHVCVLQTVLDLINSGYQPVVVEDCISSRKDQDKECSILRMRQHGAIITTSESLLFELTRSAKSPVFKEISKLVK